MPNFFLDIYMAKNPEKFAEIRSIAFNLLRIVAVYLFANTVNSIFTSLRSAGHAIHHARDVLRLGAHPRDHVRRRYMVPARFLLVLVPSSFLHIYQCDCLRDKIHGGRMEAKTWSNSPRNG